MGSVFRSNNAGPIVQTESEVGLKYRNEFVNRNVSEESDQKAVDFRKVYESKKSKGEIAEVTKAIRRGDSASTKLARAKQVQVREATWDVCIDSGDRDMRLYPRASNFSILLGRVFENVVSLSLASLEFPNTTAVLNQSNNTLSWINQEDFDIGFPVYTVEIPFGTYTYASLQNKLNDLMHSTNIKRRGGTGPPHFFIVTLDRETDLVSFTSIVVQEASENPISVENGSNVITVKAPNHGFKTGDRVWLLNVQGDVAGVKMNELNGVFVVTIPIINGAFSTDTFQFEIATFARGVTNNRFGGGKSIQVGKEYPFQFVMQDRPTTAGGILGFPIENSSLTMPEAYLESQALPVSGVVPGYPLCIIVKDHGLRIGDHIHLDNFMVSPSVYADPSHRGDFTVIDVLSDDMFSVDFATAWVTDVSRASVQTRIMTMYMPSHGYNMITQCSFSPETNMFTVETYLANNVRVGQEIWLTADNVVRGVCVVQEVSTYDTFRASPKFRLVQDAESPENIIISFQIIGNQQPAETLVTFSLDHGFLPGDAFQVATYNLTVDTIPQNYVVERAPTDKQVVVRLDTPFGRLAFDSTSPLSTFTGMLAPKQSFSLYNVEPFGGFEAQDLNSVEFFVRDVLDADTLTFSTRTGHANMSDRGGGSKMRVNSLNVGWRGTQTNAQATGTVFKRMNLTGYNYCYLRLPTYGRYSTMLSTGPVDRVFSKVQLVAPPVTTLFNTNISGKLEFRNGPLDRLREMDFQWVDALGVELDFGNFNWSCTMQITCLENVDLGNFQPTSKWLLDPLDLEKANHTVVALEAD